MQPTLKFCRFEFKAMGSPCEIRLYAESPSVATHALDAAVAEIDRLEDKYSRYREGNLMHQVNQAARVGGSIAVDDEFVSLLEFADTCYQQSDGLFDITSGVLRRVWDFERAELPNPDELAHTLDSVGWRKLSWQGGKLRFGSADMELDFGGIVKEYAADCAAALCSDQGIRHGVIDLGGDIHVIGPQPDGKPWNISIRHPRKANSRMASFNLLQGGLASSGDYERCVEVQGQRYCHILSPKTGWPVKGMAAVSVVAPRCIIAGSVCTIAMLKEKAAAAWLQELALPHVWMDLEGRSNRALDQSSLGVRWFD